MRRQAFTRITLRGNVNCINNLTETCLREQFIRPTYPPCGQETLLDIRCKSNRRVFIRTKEMNRVVFTFAQSWFEHSNFLCKYEITWQILIELYLLDAQALQKRIKRFSQSEMQSECIKSVTSDKSIILYLSRVLSVFLFLEIRMKFKNSVCFVVQRINLSL